MAMELQSRLIFIDTSAFENKNFQFDSHKLDQLCGFLEKRKLHLLTTEITIQEVKKHLKEKAKKAAGTIKKAQKEAMILRNTPTLDCHGIFSAIKEDDINNILMDAFDKFLAISNAEIVPINIVDASIVFENYFNSLPPFCGENKKNEFPDAFALEAVRKVSEEREHLLYVISCDGDMKAYAEQYENIFHLKTVDDLIDLVIRNEAELSKPVSFADKVFTRLEPEIIKTIHAKLSDMEFYPDSSYYLDVDIERIIINQVSVINKNLIEVSQHRATYELEIEISVSAEYSAANYENSPWDPEDREYVFIVTDRLHINHKEKTFVDVSLNYEDELVARATVDDIEFIDSLISLDMDDAEIILQESSYDPDDYEK
ncbi:PIN domain-containing protein [Aeromonas sp. R2-2]|uniref:PIN domain-containing protein n=1 Tax=Aeromonas TaxID=642 RepID=UPI0034A13EDB